MRDVLDVCCGSRMFWFDRKDPRTVYMDCRRETVMLKDKSTRGGQRALFIQPDIVGDFRRLPFPDDRFGHVVYDPPHFRRNGAAGWVAKKYGKLNPTWETDLRDGFAECFRVLRPRGTLVFKWNESDIPVSRILALAPEKPLYGNQCGKRAQTHWVAFTKAAP